MLLCKGNYSCLSLNRKTPILNSWNARNQEFTVKNTRVGVWLKEKIILVLVQIVNKHTTIIFINTVNKAYITHIFFTAPPPQLTPALGISLWVWERNLSKSHQPHSATRMTPPGCRGLCTPCISLYWGGVQMAGGSTLWQMHQACP